MHSACVPAWQKENNNNKNLIFLLKQAVPCFYALVLLVNDVNFSSMWFEVV